MSKACRLVVFDWEGTLADTVGQIIHTLHIEAKNRRLSPLNEELARKYLMVGLPVTVRKLFSGLGLEQQDEIIQKVQFTIASRTGQVYLLPGVKAILQKLQQVGIELAIASNKSQGSLNRDLQSSGLDKLFTVTRTASQSPAKPCSQMLEEIMDFCGFSPEETLMVGDSIIDIEMAVSVDVEAIGIDFYSQENQKATLIKAGASHVFTNYKEFANYLQLSWQREE